MAKDKNPEQPISNQRGSSSDGNEVFNFLEDELGLPPITETQRCILCRAMYEAVRAYQGTHLQNSERYKVFTDFSEALANADAQLEKFYGDGELTHTFFRMSGWKFTKMQDFKQWLHEAHKTLQAMKNEEVVRKPKPTKGAPTKTNLPMLVFYLRDGWKRAFNQSPLNAPTPKKTNIMFCGEEIDIGDRGNSFAYFVWVVNKKAGGLLHKGEYGRSIRAILEKLNDFDEDLLNHTGDEDIAILDHEENLVDRAETEVDVGENK